MTLGAKTSRDMYSTEDLVLFTALAGPLATAIENARLYEKLEEANLHRARILSSMRGAVIAVDTEGRVSTVNQGAVDMLGPVKAGSPLDALPSEVGQLLRQTLEGHCAITDFETMIVRPDGEKVPVVISSSCLQTKENQLKGAMATIYDLTQVKKLEQDVQRADRLLSLGTLAAGMAHEIKNPLVSIKTFTQLLPTRYNDPDFRTTFADIVPHEVDRIDSIVTRLLHFAHPSPAVFAPQNLRVIIDEIMALVENQLGRQCIAVVTEFPDQIVPVRGDEQQLHQAFLNLILNAMEAMRDVEHRVLHLKVHYGTMRLRPDPGASVVETECVRVVISDTGCGIPKDKIEHIFTPFYTTKEDGAGLGLSVVHRIVTEHEGQIDVSSTPHDGTTFVISLPVARSMSLIGMANS
jgi:two-component system nitrogen regulation sensor histidine kinase GlnL